MKIFLITDNHDAEIGMRLAGAECALVHNAAEASAEMEKAGADETIGLLLVTPHVKAMCKEKVEDLQRGKRPLVVCIPDGDSKDTGDESITAYIRDAIGIKI